MLSWLPNRERKDGCILCESEETRQETGGKAEGAGNSEEEGEERLKRNTQRQSKEKR